MKKNYFLLLLLISIFSQLNAKNIPENTAKIVAENFLNHLIKSNDLVQLETSYISNNKNGIASNNSTLFYVFNILNGDGFVIVSADDNIEPILGYSLEKDFDSKNIPSNVEYWFNQTNEQISIVIDQNLTSLSANTKWNSILQNTFTSKKTTPTVVKPLLKTNWNQDPYYNDLCPLDNGVKTVTGCVATAMAQAMKYWNYPTTGTGSKTYTPGTLTQQSANFGTTTYNWSNMPNNLSSANSDIAKLMYHCGVAVEMNYGTAASGGSSSYVNGSSPSAEYALKNYFGYSSSLQFVSKSSYATDALWVNVLKNELISSRVIIYRGNSSSGTSGHCFVADGFDANNYIHFNWGWGGYYNGYFSVASLIPGGAGTGGGTGDYTYNQGALIGLKPPTASAPSVNFTADYTSTNVGSTITLSDLSTNIPNSLSWTISPSTFSYVNGTSNTSKFPEISFSAIGQYSITLDATNGVGTGTLTKTTYITVNPALVSQVCDTLTNFASSDPTINYRITGGGYMAGHNVSKLKGYAEYYSNYSPYTHISGVTLEFAHAEASNSTNTISVNVYSVINGKPGLVLTSKTVKLIDIVNDVNNNQATTVVFNSPYQLTGPFYVGYTLTYAAGDTVSVYTGKSGTLSTNTSFLQQSNNVWCAWNTCWTNNQHLKISPMVTKLPTADFTYSCASINSPVNFTGATSTNSYNYNWTFTGASKTNSNFYTVSNTYPNSGTFDATLQVTGGCGVTNSVTKQITISPTSSVNVVAHASSTSFCQGQQLTLTGSGAQTYTWDNNVTNGIAFTPSAGTVLYTVTGTDASGCSGTANVSVTVTPSPTVSINSVPNNICVGQQITLTGSGAQSYTWNNNVINASAFTPALGTLNYSVTGTTNGCSNTANISITAHSYPTVIANASKTTLCSGQQLTLSGTGAQSYTWNNGVTNAVAFTPLVGTVNYTVTGDNGYGCTNTSNISVTVNQSPTVTATSSSSSINEGQSVTLTGNGASTYSWDNGVINNVAFYPFAGTNTYTVTGTAANNCTNTATLTVIVHSLADIEKIDLNNTFNSYFNSSTKELIISANIQKSTDIEINIFNSSGQNIHNQKHSNFIGDFNSIINTTKIETGIYLLKINTKEGIFSKKIIFN